MSRAELGDLVAFVELSSLIPVVYGLAPGLRGSKMCMSSSSNSKTLAYSFSMVKRCNRILFLAVKSCPIAMKRRSSRDSSTLAEASVRIAARSCEKIV
jgi:hypothetical protein